MITDKSLKEVKIELQLPWSAHSLFSSGIHSALGLAVKPQDDDIYLLLSHGSKERSSKKMQSTALQVMNDSQVAHMDV